MAEQDLDRNEAATPYKLEKARERGQVGKSADFVSALVFTVAVVCLYWKGWDGLLAQFRYDHQLLSQAGRIEASPANLWSLVGAMVRDSLVMLAPFLCTLMVAAVVGNMLQTGPILSMHPVKPDFDRVNPIQGMKRLFSMRTLFESARDCETRAAHPGRVSRAQEPGPAIFPAGLDVRSTPGPSAGR